MTMIFWYGRPVGYVADDLELALFVVFWGLHFHPQSEEEC